MKKFLPILVIVLAFSGFLAIQVSLDQVQTSANQSTIVKDKNARFENLFQTTKLTSLSHGDLILKDIKKPVVIINFWASWCSPCLREIPALKSLGENYKDKVEIIAINTDEEDQMKMIDKMKDKYKMDFPIVADKQGKISDQFLVSVIPYSIIFINGSVYKSHQGFFDFADPELLKHLQGVLKK